MSRPACMSDDEWLAWSAMNERLYGLGHADSPCRDCTPLFHRDMLAGGMCDGQPLPPEREPSPTGRPLLSPPLTDWVPSKGNPTYATEAERMAARRESSRRSAARSRATAS